MFPEEMVRPFRDELTSIGFREMRTPAQVDEVLKNEKGTVLVVVNSVCGCAAGKARPAIAAALRQGPRPEVLTTVFAGQDPDATERARGYFTGYRPSSPSIALMRDGKLQYMMERHQIESRDARAIAEDLTQAFAQFCAAPATAAKTTS
jgi:putative YphP/YqiW family bacilliredoxin